MSRVTLESIPALTFYKDSVTLARRTSPIPQLVCLGKPCSLYTPDVVRCENIGGSGAEVDWRCEADLPSSLRFGKVQVSCEGWTGPGDPYVLKGSCALEYHLVQLPNSLRDNPSSLSGAWSYLKGLDLSGILFILVWTFILLTIAYKMLASCIRAYRLHRPSSSSAPPQPTPPPYSSHGGGGGGPGAFPGTYSDDDASYRSPPPPYTKHLPPDASAGSNSGAGSSSGAGAGGGEAWRPGFWTGAALGGLGGHLLHRGGPAPPRPRSPLYDWERERERPPLFMGAAPRYRPSYPSSPPPFGYPDRGEGSSSGRSLGGMRSSTGFGGSSVR